MPHFLSLLFGGKVLDDYETYLLNDGNKSGYQMMKDALDSWTPENVNASNPIFVPNNSNKSNERSTRFLHKSDFIKLKNISFGYLNFLSLYYLKCL